MNREAQAPRPEEHQLRELDRPARRPALHHRARPGPARRGADPRLPRATTRCYSQKEFRYNNITQPNRNRLLWIDPTVDGVKTGHTEAAGYCLDRLGQARRRAGCSRWCSAPTSDALRAQESQKLLNFGFQFYDTRAALRRRASRSARSRSGRARRDALKAGFDERPLRRPCPRATADEAQGGARQPAAAGRAGAGRAEGRRAEA